MLLRPTHNLPDTCSLSHLQKPNPDAALGPVTVDM
jgi:hypothetical protein